MERKRLGRGLNALLGSAYGSADDVSPSDVAPQRPEPTNQAISPLVQPEHSVDARNVPIESIVPNPYQPRYGTTDADIPALADSIRQSGILQPLTVRAKGSGFELVAGERRWRAAKLAGLRSVPVIVRRLNEEQMLELALVENIQRKDLNAVERAAAYRRFCGEFNLTPEEVARRVGEDRSTVVNYLRLLDLSKSILDMVAGEKITMGHARSLLAVGDRAKREQMAQEIIDRKLSVRDIENRVRLLDARHADLVTADDRPDPQAMNLRDLERRLQRSVGTRVSIRPGRRKGRGRIVVEYYSLDDFDRITARLGLEAG